MLARWNRELLGGRECWLVGICLVFLFCRERDVGVARDVE